MKIDALPKFAKLFKSSQSVSRKFKNCQGFNIDDIGKFHNLQRKSNKRKFNMIEDDEKVLLKQKTEEVKEEKYRLDEEIIRLNSQIDEYLKEKLANDEMKKSC